MNVLRPLLASFLAGLARVISGASARWVECRPTTGQRVYFANHTSHFDFIVLWAALPQEVRALTRPVAARDYWETGKLRQYFASQVFQAVLIDRGSVEMSERARQLDLMLNALGEGHSLILFPEGTRGTGEEVGAFRSGLYHLCKKKPGLELVPVHIENLNRILPKGEFLPVPLLSYLTFGPPLYLGEDEPKEAFLARAREAVCRTHA